MFKVTGFELIEFESDGVAKSVETAHQQVRYLTAKELTKYSETHQRFKVETIKWEPARED